ncbi:DUF6230 family protein [Tuberibacillus sp. Marseille-P3662]|uniref:DUF6230 family protein n=1 Tax=Tuberibacillus sp. Marseille-P3662 TaxID=1965358 RepID=UPI000A1C8D97|nr:DUF6230 family protein [Tuberibacillus sp. Marseille-P3662]
MKSDKMVGRTVKKKFLVALLSGFLMLGGLVGAFGATGTALAMPLGGMGDFYVQFDKLEGKGFKFFPKVGETGESDAAPMVRNKINQATINGLHIYKDVKLPGGKWIRVNITASKPVKINGLIQDARFIDANLKFNDLAIKEQNTNDYKKNWTQDANQVTITDAKIVTDYLFQSMVNLQGAKIYIEDIKGPDKTSSK